MTNVLKRLVDGEEGATMVEYALIGAALITVVTALGSAIGGKFSSVSTTITGDGGGS